MSKKTHASNIPFLTGGGEMGELIRQKDWSKTPVGNPQNWAQSLRTTLSIILNSKFPMFLFWGPELICFYNDAYRQSLGNEGKHPNILGGRGEDYWSEIWKDIKPLIDTVLAGGEASWSEDQLLPIYRNGKMEDVYWSFSYSAVYDESGKPAGVFVTCSENTQKVMALKSLEDREKQLKFTIDAAELAIWDIDPVTNSLKSNLRLKEWFGLDTEREIELTHALDRIIEKDRQRVVEAMKAALQPDSGGNFEIEYAIFNPHHNKERIIRTKGKALFDENNVPYRFSGTGQDITEQVNALKKMKESEETFHTLADNISQLAWMADAQGWIYWYNQRWYNYTGTTLEDMQGWGWQKVHHPDHLERVVNRVQHSWNTGEVWEDTFPMRGQDGQYRWFLSRATPIRDNQGKVLRWFGTNTDITEQNTLIEKLNETVSKLNLYEKVVINIKEAVLITEAEPFNLPGPRILYVNDAFYTMTGYTPEEVIGKTPRILQGPKTDRKQLDKIRHALEHWQSVKVELINYKKDGSEFFVEFEIIPVANEKGWFTHWVSVQRDITERKLAEKKILESEELLRKTKEQLELTFTNVPAAIFLYNNKKEILYANKKAAHLLGYNTVEELLQEKYYDVLMQKGGENYYVKDENDEPFLREKLPSVNALKIGKPGEVVFSMEKRSGGPKLWFLNKSAPILEENGEVSMVLTTSTDITAQKTAEEKIRNSEERFRQLAEQAPMWVWMTDLEMNMLYANHEVLKHAGLSHFSQFIEHSWVNFTHPADIIIIAEHFKKAVVEQTFFEFEARLKNAQTNQYEWFYMKAVPRIEAHIFIGFIGTAININQQKIHLEKLQESEENFRQLSDLMPEKVSRSDAYGNIIYYNHNWLEYTGLSFEALKSWGWAQAMHPDDTEELTRLWTHSLMTGDALEMEFRILNKEGEYRWHLCRSAAIKDEEGNIKNWVGVTVDIEHQKRFARELEKQVEERTTELQSLNEMLLKRNELLTISENFNRSLIDLSPNVVYIFDIEHNKPIFLNRAGCNIIGYEWQEVHQIMQIHLLIVHPDDRTRVCEMIDKLKVAQDGDVVEHEYRVKNAQGTWTPVLARETVFKRNSKNEVTQLIGIAVDITHLKQVTQQIQDANELLIQKNESLIASELFNRTLTDVSPTMVYIHDIEKNKPIFLNNTYLNFVGYNWEQVVEFGSKFISTVVHPNDLAFCTQILQKVLTSQVGEVFEGNFRRKNAFDVWVPFFNRVTAFKRNSKNEVIQIIGVAIDISDLKKAEDVLHQKNEALEKMNKELQSFAYISSHDLQEPLRKIQTFAKRIMDKEYDNLSDNGKDYLRRMEESAHRMRTLIDDLLAYSRTNTQERKFEKIHLQDIIEEVKANLNEELQDKQAVIEVIDLCECNVIPFQLRQLLHNLISNALKFSNLKHPPYITIKSKIAKGIELNFAKLAPEKEYCHICSADNGIGFEQQYGEKIFEVFQRLNSKEKYAGTGIGLAIVKKIVENHNGIIIATGELNKGATFDIYLPSF